ncbi:anti-sigma factor domain-containing protein [Kitasatospora hibisci]|uniref:anti-sigma factor n=1 Tax=Kitasatospora hibisci TaxID=3369522 RepID=UPI003753F07A
MTTLDDGNPHLLTGAYALNALDDDERDAFEAHLRGCDTCGEEVAGFSAALTRLDAAQAVPPPPGMRARVLARLEYERQLPPGPLRSEVVAASAAPRAVRRRARWPRFALAASLAAATALGVLSVQQHDQARQERAAAERLRVQQAAFGELLTAPDARVTTATAAGSGTGSVVWSASRNRAGFLAAGLPAPGPGRVYELWLDHAGTLSPAGLLPAGDGALVLTAPLDGARAVGVTEEPAGGSDRPTTQPIMALQLTRARAA